jgi:hypothetical protein
MTELTNMDVSQIEKANTPGTVEKKREIAKIC